MSDARAATSSKMRLLLELGRGGMGVAYLAFAQGPAGFAKLKVVKRLRSDLAADPRAVDMFLAEARLAARLRHPNVVQTNEVGFDGKHYFLEMEYLEGQSLDAIERRAERGERALPQPFALWIIAQTCAGLHYAHELADFDGTPLRVVHRDVSPHNVFVTYDGHVKLLDFGIAKAAGSGSDTQTGMIKGKARYMAPEQAASGALDRRADVFAVGVMLWQTLTGERLWGELGDLEIFMKLQTTSVAPPSSVKPDVPADLDALCRRMLARDPAQRPATAREVGEALEAHLDRSGARVGSREVAAWMAETFADRRKEVEREIQARMKEDRQETVDVPAMPPAETSAMGSAAFAPTELAARQPTTVRQRKQIRTLRQMVGMAIVVALVASASAGVVALRARARRTAATAQSASATASPPGCTTHASCAAGAICRKTDGVCVALETAECKVMAEPGDARDDATVWFGVMLPKSGPRAQDGVRFTRAVDLARRDFVQISRGLPAPSAQGAARPLAFVSCDDAAGGERPARHLVEDLGVPAIIGFGSSEALMSLASTLFIPHDVLAVAAVNQSALITSISQPPGHPRLVFRTALSLAQVAPPMSLFVSNWIEPRLRAAGVVTDAMPLRVALVRPGSTNALSISDAIFTSLRFNGRSALDNGAGFRQMVFASPSIPQPARSAADVVNDLLQFRPHVILAVDDDDILVPGIFEPVERAWPSGLRYRPIVMVNAGVDILFSLVGKNVERRHRYFSTQSQANTMANAKFTMRYNEVFAEQVTINNSPAGTYDAAYLLAYVTAAVGSEPVTGSSLARAIGRLVPPGQAVDVGPTHIPEALEALRQGRNVDLHGANGTLDFDLASGEPAADSVIQCIGVDESGAANDGIDSGLYFDSASKTLRGEMHCP